MLNEAVLSQLLNFGHAGVMLWILFKMEFMQKEYRLHMKHYHKEKDGE